MAGFSDVKAETLRLQSRSTARNAATGLCQGTPLRNEIEERMPGQLDEAIQAVRTRIAAKLGEDDIQASMQAHIFIACK